MKCTFCMEDIADNSEKCALCNSELVKLCPFCMEKIQADALKCKHCGSMLNAAQPQQQKVQPPIQPQHQPPVMQQSKSPLPPEAAGWCWGGFFLSWIWAIGNSTWIGLLALVPVVNFIMMFVLGAKGREWAWKNKQWQSVEHFNSVQKKWSITGGILFVIGVVVAVAIPQFNAYRIKDFNKTALSDLRNSKTTLEAYFADHQRYPDTLESAKYIPSKNVYVKCAILPDAYVCGAAHKKGDVLYITDNTEAKISNLEYKAGDAIQLPYDPKPMGSAKADEYSQNQPAGQVQPDATQQQPNGQVTFSPSFDCAKASTGAERMICSNNDLAQADVQLAQAYKAALSKSPDKAALKKEQGAWIRSQRDACSDASAMLQVYQDRISQLSR